MKMPTPAVLFALGATLAVLCLLDLGVTASKAVRFSSSVGLIAAWVVCGLALHLLGREGPN